MHMKKIKEPIEKTGYPVSGNLRISGRISESGFSKSGYSGIRYPGSKSVSGTTLGTYLTDNLVPLSIKFTIQLRLEMITM